MPKLNITHIPERLREVIEQLERGEEVEAKKNKTLLNDKQQKALDDAWTEQQRLRKTHKSPKTEEQKQQIGWKDKREVRIESYKQALTELEKNTFDDYLSHLEKEQVKATKAYLSGYFSANERQDRNSAGRIAMTRSGFYGTGSSVISRRDKEVFEMEEKLRKQFDVEMTDEEREHLKLLKDHENALLKGVKKRKGKGLLKSRFFVDKKDG
jgi:hypothetical protein